MVKLLAGGNPQIAKGEGDAPVQSYLDALPGWKQDACKQLDALITHAVPGVSKAVKWNTPFYGKADHGWFLGYHCLKNAIKVSFFRGTSLSPLPPVASKQADVRYAHLYEGEGLDEVLWTTWIQQAADLPGWKP